MKTKYLATIIGALFALANVVAAQTPAPNPVSAWKVVTTDPLAAPPKVEKKAAEKSAKQIKNWEKTWSIQTRFSGSYDSNLEHELKSIRGEGFVPSIVAGYEMKSRRNRFRFVYSFAAARYSLATDLNRVGNYGAAAHRLTLGKWSLESEAEISLKGTNEDRETGNQYIATETLGYRFDKKTRVSFFVAYRIRRFPAEDADRNAVNPMAGMKFSRRLTKKFDWNIAYRYDINRAINPRQNYMRSQYRTGLDFQASPKNKIEAELTLRARRYRTRKVEVNNVDVFRRDRKWTLDVVWTHDFSRRWGIETAYQFERQTSNDIEKFYNNHRLVFSFVFNWGNGDPIVP